MIEVRYAHPDEAQIIHQITLDAFEPSCTFLDPPSGALSETLEELQTLTANNGAVIALLDNQPAGACRIVIHQDHVYCGRLGVFPSMQGKGVGTAILNFLEDEARKRNLPEVRLATRERLTSNMEFYQRLGYIPGYRCQHPRGTDMVVELSKPVGQIQPQ